MQFLFAWRYFKAKKSTNAINIIAWVSISAIIVGTIALVLVLSVFNGFEDLVKSLYASFYTDLKVLPAKGKFIEFTSEQLQSLSQTAGIKNYSLVAEDKAWMQNGDQQLPVYLKGVDSNFEKITGVANKLVKGKYILGTADAPAAILGVGIENALAVESDRSIIPLTVYIFNRASAKEITDPANAVSSEQINPSGAFLIQQDFDDKYVITNLAFMQRMLGLKAGEYSAIEIAIDKNVPPETVQRSLKKIFGKNYLVQTRYEQNQSLYGVMHMEKWVIYAVLTLILIVAAFNMVGALTMLVLEKQKDIQVLKAMGANNSLVQRIFLNEGILLGLLGGLVGIAAAIGICWLQQTYKLVPIQGGSFLINYYPVKVVPQDLLMVLTTIFLIVLLASWFPAKKAAMQAIELKT